jgi:hypothetical protein
MKTYGKFSLNNWTSSITSRDEESGVNPTFLEMAYISPEAGFYRSVLFFTLFLPSCKPILKAKAVLGTQNGFGL